MPATSEIIRLRQQRSERARRNPAGWIGISCGLLLIVLMVFAGTGFALLYTSLTAGLPSIDTLPVLFDPLHGQLLQPTKIMDRSGDPLILADNTVCLPAADIVATSPASASRGDAMTPLPHSLGSRLEWLRRAGCIRARHSGML